MYVRPASAADLDALVSLFDGYRQFYEFAPDLDGARAFLAARFTQQDSIILLVFNDQGEAMGFTQLYPSFSSGRMARIYILNDLFVAPWARAGGAGRALLEAATARAKADGVARLTLSTQVENTTAQSLYESAGWQRDTAFHTYNLALT